MPRVRPIFGLLPVGTHRGVGSRGKAQRALERAVEAMVPESATIALAAMRRHKRKFGVYPNLIRPKTFNEKVLHRMVFDRRPILTELQDKYAARDYVRERIGDHVLPRLYWVTKTPGDIPFDDLPDKFVVKATHGSHWIYIVPDKARLNRLDLIARCNTWVSQNYYDLAREWHTSALNRASSWRNSSATALDWWPLDYKFYVFYGRVHLIHVDSGRFVDQRRDVYRKSWARVDVITPFKPIGGVPRPPHLDEMIECAEKLGEGLDFLRVDLYDAGKVYFGELTMYPAAGCEVFVPDEWNRYLGGLWDLSFGKTSSRSQNETVEKP